jgi:peptidoglycan/xylan/chitin deacetylase (PgdA/CDA1 family)
LLGQHVQRSPSRWWRAPFGARDRRVLRIAGELGYVSVYWTIDSLDSVAPPKSSSFLVEQILHYSDVQLDGAIILMHVGEAATAEALPEILSALQRRGFRLVTISDLVVADTSGMRDSQQAPATGDKIHAAKSNARVSLASLRLNFRPP